MIYEAIVSIVARARSAARNEKRAGAGFEFDFRDRHYRCAAVAVAVCPTLRNTFTVLRHLVSTFYFVRPFHPGNMPRRVKPARRGKRSVRSSPNGVRGRRRRRSCLSHVFHIGHTELASLNFRAELSHARYVTRGSVR